MTVIALTNSISPGVVERATADSDPYERETQLNAFAHNFDDHDHALGKNLGVKRVQTTVAPAASGEVRVNGDTLQWWGATAGAIQSALTTTQTITGATLGDPIVRDAIQFGEQGTALAPDVSLTRTAAGVLGLSGALSSASGTLPRLAIGSTGTLSLTPDVGAEAIRATIGAVTFVVSGGAANNNARIGSAAANSRLEAYGVGVVPFSDSFMTLGEAAYRWTTVHATNGTIQTSSIEAKEHIRDFSPDDVLDAVRVLRAVRFDYRRPEGQEGDEDPTEAALRKNQIGFLSEEAPAMLTLGDNKSVSPQQTAVIGLAGLKALLAKLDAHEVRLDALEAGD